MIAFCPHHPSENVQLPDEIYTATIMDVSHGEYAGDGHYIRIVLWLHEPERYLVTNVYFPHGHNVRSQRRLWILCQIVGLELTDVLDAPEKFRDQRISIRTFQVDAEKSPSRRTYSDVQLFLPCQRTDSLQEEAVAL